MRRKIVLAMLLAAWPAAALAGGQADISITPLPKSITAGQAFPLEFRVEHAKGVPFAGLKPTIIATRGTERVALPAKETRTPGLYTALVTLPRGGSWTMTVDVRHCGNTAVLRNVVAQSAAPARMARRGS